MKQAAAEYNEEATQELRELLQPYLFQGWEAHAQNKLPPKKPSEREELKQHVAALLERGADPDAVAQSFYRSPDSHSFAHGSSKTERRTDQSDWLHFALFRMEPPAYDIAELLLERGANIDNAFDPLSTAIRCYNAETFKWLVEHDASLYWTKNADNNELARPILHTLVSRYVGRDKLVAFGHNDAKNERAKETNLREIAKFVIATDPSQLTAKDERERTPPHALSDMLSGMSVWDKSHHQKLHKLFEEKGLFTPHTVVGDAVLQTKSLTDPAQLKTEMEHANVKRQAARSLPLPLSR